jgi:hypothetical protein
LAEAGAVVEDSAAVAEDSAGLAVGEGLAVAVPEDDSDA